MIEEIVNPFERIMQCIRYSVKLLLLEAYSLLFFAKLLHQRLTLLIMYAFKNLSCLKDAKRLAENKHLEAVWVYSFLHKGYGVKIVVLHISKIIHGIYF